MTKQEIETRFKAGEELVKTLYIRGFGCTINGLRITEKQFNTALKSMPHTMEVVGLGITRHVYKYKAE